VCVCVWSQNSENEFDVWLDMATLSASAHPPNPKHPLIRREIPQSVVVDFT